MSSSLGSAKESSESEGELISPDFCGYIYYTWNGISWDYSWTDYQGTCVGGVNDCVDSGSGPSYDGEWEGQTVGINGYCIGTGNPPYYP
jgi:hypothetical protein